MKTTLLRERKRKIENVYVYRPTITRRPTVQIPLSAIYRCPAALVLSIAPYNNDVYVYTTYVEQAKKGLYKQIYNMENTQNNLGKFFFSLSSICLSIYFFPLFFSFVDKSRNCFFFFWDCALRLTITLPSCVFLLVCPQAPFL